MLLQGSTILQLIAQQPNEQHAVTMLASPILASPMLYNATRVLSGTVDTHCDRANRGL